MASIRAEEFFTFIGFTMFNMWLFGVYEAGFLSGLVAGLLMGVRRVTLQIGYE